MSSRYLKVESEVNLVRDTQSGGIINTNSSEFDLYMQRKRLRVSSADKMKDVCREINTLKAEMFEIKELLKNMCKGKE